jgi:hypothetical protein
MTGVGDSIGIGNDIAFMSLPQVRHLGYCNIGRWWKTSASTSAFAFASTFVT